MAAEDVCVHWALTQVSVPLAGIEHFDDQLSASHHGQVLAKLQVRVDKFLPKGMLARLESCSSCILRILRHVSSVLSTSHDDPGTEQS